MKKRNILLVALSLVLIAAISVGATLAYFTDKAEATNVVTMGNVKVKLYATASPITTVAANQPISFKVNDTINGVIVENIGTNDAFVRISVTKAWKTGGVVNTNLLGSTILLGDIGTDWAKIGDYYYYTKALENGQKTPALFTGATLTDGITNSYSGSSAHIDFICEAIQSDNLPSGNSATNWPSTTIEHVAD